MAGSIFMRASGAVMSHIELGISAAERSSRHGLSRQSIREIETALEEVRTQRFTAESGRDRAAGVKAKQIASAAEWKEKAVYALSKGRADLAEQAIGRQLEAEREAQAAENLEQTSAIEIDRLVALATDLTAERKRMVAELAAVAQEPASAPTDARQPSTVEQRVERARARFEQIIDDARTAWSVSPAAAAEDEIDALRRADQIAERLAELRMATDEPSTKKRAPKRS